MKSDCYLNACLEQANKSPLRYQHGSIVVRGGRVIGRGYNDYRPGFCSGTIKDGRHSSSRTSSDSSLSMHAEMMAIQSAMSRTISSIDLQHEKQLSHVKASSKPKRQARQQILQEYVDSVCTAGPDGLCHVQAQCFEQDDQQQECPEEQFCDD